MCCGVWVVCVVEFVEKCLECEFGVVEDWYVVDEFFV